MCLITIAIEQSEKYPFILLSNRDEFYNRPTDAMHWWEGQNILAGKDLQAGGTWIAFNRLHQFAAVTNYRDPQNFRPDAPSRGMIPVDLTTQPIDDFREYVKEKYQLWNTMNGFNLIFHNGEKTFYYSNVSHKIQELSPGIHALSNAFLNTPWPKVTASKTQLQKLIAHQKTDEESFLDILSDAHTFLEEELPDTGVDIEMEKILSPICIQSPAYGTRVNTLFLRGEQSIVTEKNILTQEVRRFVL